ncbi:MAG TPA: carboxylesterase/lipase family protein [Candidatus Nanopelagicales bacterium]
MRRMSWLGLLAAAALGITMALPIPIAAQVADGPVVQTSDGPVRGSTEGALEVFRGIPYSAPPTGERRWLPPAAPQPWTEVRDATTFGPACPQDPDPHEMAEGTPTSEDCLTVNVWAPAAAHQAPVMVFVHGGGFTAGSTWDPWYDGAALARRGVVLVTLQYRVGPFGWLDVSGLGPQYTSSGNNGLLDQMAALRWVRRNAAAFGGDPGNITLFGESAGAISISALLGSPAADGLYDRVIVESGTAGTVATRDWSQRVFRRFLELAGVAAAQDLRGLTTEQLLTAARALYATEFSDTAFHPVVDGSVLPDLPMRRMVAADGPDVPVIIGTNLDEARYWLYYIPELDRLPLRYYRPWLESLVGDRADAVVAAYRGERPELDEAQTGLAMAGDVGFRMPALRMAEALSARGVPVWMYLTTLQSPDLGGRMGAAHAIELPLVLGNRDAPRAPELVGTDPGNAALSEALQRLWVGFASGATPQAAGAPAWPRFSADTRSTLVVDRPLAVQDDPYPASRAAWGTMAFDGSDPGLDRLTPLQYEGTNPNDPLVIAAVIGWGWVLLGLGLVVAVLVGSALGVRHLLRRRRRSAARPVEGAGALAQAATPEGRRPVDRPTG